MPPGKSTGSLLGDLNLDGLDFEERLAALAARLETAAPIDDISKEDSARTAEEAAEGRFWTPQFVTACVQDLLDLTWPTRKTVTQNFFISQAAVSSQSFPPP